MKPLWLLLKNLLYVVVVPGLIAGGLPLQLFERRAQWPLEWSLLPLTGLVLAVIGFGFFLFSAAILAARGQGTPAFFDPTKKLTRRGPYKWVRNPMYLSLMILVGGEALLFRSWHIAAPARHRLRGGQPAFPLRRCLRGLQARRLPLVSPQAQAGAGNRPALRSPALNRGLLDPALVEIHQVGDAEDVGGAVGATHVGERFLEEITTGGRHAFLDVFAVPFGGAQVSGEKREQAAVDLVVTEVGVEAFVDDFLHGRGVDAEVHAQETVHAALVVLGVAGRERAALFHVFALRDEARQMQQTGGAVRLVGGGQLAEDFAGRTGDGAGRHEGTAVGGAVIS
jgi:hypothetical protein